MPWTEGVNARVLKTALDVSNGLFKEDVILVSMTLFDRRLRYTVLI